MANLIHKTIAGPDQMYAFEQTFVCRLGMSLRDPQLKPTVSAIPPVQGKGKEKGALA